MKCHCCKIDINLIGIIISSIFLILCFIFSYSDSKESTQSNCEFLPDIEFNDSQILHHTLLKAIENSNNKIYMAISDISSKFFKDFYKSKLVNASNRGVEIKIILPDYIKDEISSLLNRNKIEYYSSVKPYMEFAIIDDKSFLFNCMFTNKTNCTSLFTTIDKCKAAVEDVNSFFNYQVSKINGELPSIIPIKKFAKTSAILPINQKNSSDGMFYFFNNPLCSSEPLRISTSTLFNQIFPFNFSEGNIYIYSTVIPSFSSYEFSFYQTFLRILMSKGSALNIIYLVPKSDQYSLSEWLNITVAFDRAEVFLYDEKFKGPNFIISKGVAFVFSHPIDDDIVNKRLGFHYSTNNTQIVDNLLGFFNEVKTNYSSNYHLKSR